MPRLVKNIEGIIFDNFETTTILVKNVEGFYGPKDNGYGVFDYIKLDGFTAFIQDFSKIESVEDLSTPPTFGLRNNTDFITLEISY